MPAVQRQFLHGTGALPPALPRDKVVKLAIIPVTPFQQNCSLIICPSTNRACFVDPGGEVDRLFEVLAKRGSILEAIGALTARINAQVMPEGQDVGA